LNTTKTAYHLYTNEDLAKKLIYVESSRGCPFSCDFCLSALKTDSKVREFPLEQFLTEMDKLVKRGVKTFKFLDRTFNSNITRAIQICEFFLEKIEERKKTGQDIPLVVHFEMVPSLFSSGLNEVLTRFPPGTLRLEIGFQTLNTKVAARIRVPSKPAKDLETLRLLCEKTNAIIHADLIAGLPGENLKSFGRGFDRLWQALSAGHNIEIQVGILKQLPGAPISRHNDDWGMRYAPLPPYEVEETSVLSTGDLQRIKNFARFWELIVNRGLIKFAKKESIFDEFMAFSGILFAHFGRNWGIDRNELLKFILDGNSLISLKLLQTF
ncbi:MAG: radical SAM protein, partial [Treponema sp.]|nr:radical SAM protein [Treponema sp.]